MWSLSHTMKLRGFLIVGTLLLGPSLASADRVALVGDRVSEFGVVTTAPADAPFALARQVLPAANTTVVPAGAFGDGHIAFAQSRIVYLNRTGVTLLPGNNDSRTNRSTLVSQQTTIPAWNVNATVWNDTVTCMRDLFSRFDVEIVTSDPGNVPHIEAVFGGSPTQLGMPSNVAGVSPFTLDCSVIENSIVFTFTGAFNFNARQACEIMAQEVAHSYGLDHQLLASDPMTYLNYNGNRAFQDQTVSCGESSPRPCGINGSTCRPNQNSVALLRERLGVPDAVPPTMAWSSPADNAIVPPGFEVRASGTDNVGVTGAILRIDGNQVDAQTGPGPFTFVTPTSLAEGPHTVVVEITDGKNLQSETRNVIVRIGANPDDGGTGTGTGTGTDGSSDYGDVMGGCAAGGHGSGLALLGLFALGLVVRRRT
jgi:hypothetical protein